MTATNRSAIVRLPFGGFRIYFLDQRPNLDRSLAELGDASRMTDPNPCDEEGVPGASHCPTRQTHLPASLAPAKRRTSRWSWLLLAILSLIVMWTAWLWSIHGAMSKLERQLAVPGAHQEAAGPSEQQQQILSFETRLARVLGASVESKLRTLERSVERGPLNAEELRLIESTATELRLLQSNPGALEAATLEAKEHPRYQAFPADESSDKTDALLAEIAELRKLYYASLISLALCWLIAAGFWINARLRHRLIEAPTRHRLPVLKSLVENRER